MRWAMGRRWYQWTGYRVRCNWQVDSTMQRVPWLVRWQVSRERQPTLLVPGDRGVEGRQRWFSRPFGRAFLDGYLFDRPGLCLELGIDAQSTDAEIGLHGYRTWGTGLAERLRGGFVLSIWDTSKERLFVVRDALGLHPCYFAFKDGVFLLSSEVDAILVQPEMSRRMRREVVAEFLMVSHPRHQIHDTLYGDVQRLPPGHLLECAGERPTIRQYWEPLPTGFTWAHDDEVREIPKRLERAVDRCLSVGANSLALSGGFDSVSLAVLAADQRGGADPLQAISLRFPDGPCDEGRTQEAVADALGMPQHMMTVEQSLDGRDPIEGALATSRYLPSPVFSPWQSMYSGLFKAAGEPDELQILMGTGGDDMFLVDFSYGADCLRSLRLSALWRYFRSWQRSSPFSAAVVAREVLLNGAVRTTLRGALSTAFERTAPRLWSRARAWRHERNALPNWFSRSDRSLVADLISRRQAVDDHGSEGSYVRAMRSLTLRPLLLLELEQAFAWGSFLGTTFLYPFFDRDLVELSLRIHPEDLIAGGRSKAPLRQLVGRRLPGVALPSRKVDFSRMLHRVLRSHASSAWRSLGGPLRLEESGLVDPERFAEVIEDFLNGRSDDWVPVWFGLSTEVWLRQQDLSW